MQNNSIKQKDESIKDKPIKDKSFFSLMNFSFQSENNDKENIPEELQKNPYLTKDHVPELEIVDKNKIICDKKEYEIKEYIKQKNNAENEFLDDIMIYNYCENCKKDYNKYFCKICLKNICDICYGKCKIEKHDIINLEEMKKESISNIIIIKNFLNNNIIPIKEVNENLTKEENNEDIFLIIEIISQDYINYFHLENIRRILKYIDFYSNNYSVEKYGGFGKVIYEDGHYYIGQFKDNLRNGKGTLYNKNGNIKYEGDWINNKKEGNGKYIYEDGNYYIGQFKDNLRDGKGKVYLPNGIMIYDGIFINDKSTLNCIIN